MSTVSNEEELGLVKEDEIPTYHGPIAVTPLALPV
jgi:hypothetical protein